MAKRKTGGGRKRSMIGTIARRGFLIGGVAIAGGVAYGVWRYAAPYDNPLEDDGAFEGAAVFNPYVAIDQSGVTVIAPRAEMGQGVHTALAALVAEEMDLRLDQLTVIHGPPAPAYYNQAIFQDGLPFDTEAEGIAPWLGRGAADFGAKMLAVQVTGGSTSVADAFDKMRRAGAAARVGLVAAAAELWDLEEDQLRAEDGAVVAPTGEKASYAALAERAAALAPAAAEPKAQSDWTLLGRPLQRVDTAAKAFGAAEFGVDVRLQDQLYASAVFTPAIGVPMTRYDASALKDDPSVMAIIPITEGVAVVAATTWEAMKAAEKIRVEHGPVPFPKDDAAFDQRLSEAFVEDRINARLRDDGDAAGAVSAAGAKAVRAEYQTPHLAHACMEPMNCTARLRDGALEIWAGLQAPKLVADIVAARIGASEAQAHVTYLGGGFGRRGEIDYVQAAAETAKGLPSHPDPAKNLAGRPVQLVYSREADTRRDVYRPPALAKMAATLDADGAPIAISADVATSSVMRSAMKRYGVAGAGPDRILTDGLHDQPYRLPHYRVLGYDADLGAPYGFWRSVGYSNNPFFLESFLDELSVEGGLDPLEMRLRLLSGEETASRTLQAVATLAEWRGRRFDAAEGRRGGRGLAYCRCFGSHTAMVVDVSAGEDGIRIERAFIAADVGVALDPGTIESQLASGLIFGLSAAIDQQITFADGLVEQGNFDDYDALRIDACPEIKTVILENGEAIGGVGEIGTPPAAPALANAVFAATDTRIRRLPLSREADFV